MNTHHSESAEAIAANRREREELDAFEVINLVDQARRHYEAFQEAWGDAARLVRSIDEWQYHRIEAYPGWDGNRDVGAGQSMHQWMDELDERMHDSIEAPGLDEDDEL